MRSADWKSFLKGVKRVNRIKFSLTVKIYEETGIKNTC